MTNPFETLEARLSNIENLLLDIKHQPDQAESGTGDKFLNVKEAAEFLCLTKPTIYGKVSRGELPVMKRGNRLYFSREELTVYLKEGRKKTNTEVEDEAHTYLKKKKG
jgi:excisionase family DNA binding protein